MKKTTLILITILNIFFVDAQQPQEDELIDVFSKYRELIEDKNYDKAFDYYSKDFLKYIPKKKLKKEFLKLNNNPNFEYSVTNSILISKSKIIEEGNKKYTLIKYGANTHIKFSDNATDDYINERKNHFKNIYKGNYRYIKETNEIITYKEQVLIGVYEKTWSFLIYKKKLKPYMYLWMPKGIIDKLLEL